MYLFIFNFCVHVYCCFLCCSEIVSYTVILFQNPKPARHPSQHLCWAGGRSRVLREIMQTELNGRACHRTLEESPKLGSSDTAHIDTLINLKDFAASRLLPVYIIWNHQTIHGLPGIRLFV